MPVPRSRHIVKIARDYFRRIFAVNNSTEPQMLMCIPVAVSGTATADFDVVLATKFEVVRVDCLKQNGAGAANTITVKNSSNAISNAITCAVDNTLTSSGTLDDAYSTLNEGDTLRVTATRAAGNVDALVLIYGFIRA